MTRTFAYNEFNVDKPVQITEDEILRIYYPYWSDKMLKRGGLSLMTKENCIDDWVITNWAWEIK